MFALTTTVLGTTDTKAYASEHERNVAAHNLVRDAVKNGLTVDYPNEYTVTVS